MTYLTGRGAQNILPHKENTRMLLGSAADQVQKLLDIVGKDAKQEGGAAAESAESTTTTSVSVSQPFPW